MKCYNEFPLSTVIYNMVTLGGALVVVAQFEYWATAGYLLLLALTGVGLLATVCARCGYYGCSSFCCSCPSPEALSC